jgi:hypothetical protein
MKPRFLTAIVVSFLSMSLTGVAGDRPEDVTSPFRSIVPASFAGDRDSYVLSAFSEELPAPAEAFPEPLNAPPPSDPAMPDWGDYASPTISPIARPPVQYSLIGPPRGFNHDVDRQQFFAWINDPDEVLEIDSRIGQSVDIHRPDGMGPIGVFADHTLPAGTAFISYRYLQNSFDQNYSGSHRIGVPTNYPLAPKRMLQDSQIALVEYGVTQDLTMMAFLPFQHNEINFQTATGSEKQTFTNPGDIRIMGLLAVTRGDRSQSHVNFGLSIPVGFLEQVAVYGGTPTAVPYQLQTSSGTYDLLVGYTYRKQTDCWTFGAQVNGVVPTGKNTLGFELGNQLQLTGWMARRWSDRWSTSARLDGHLQGNIRGDDSRLDPTLSPVNQPGAQGRQYVNGLLGANYLWSRPGHRIREQRLFIESGVPFYQWVDGTQVGLSWVLNAGWGMTF